MNLRHLRVFDSDRTLFLAYLVTLAWLPLPLGSNRPWAAAIMETAIYLIAIFWLITFLHGSVRLTPGFRLARPALLLLFLWLIYLLFQIAPLPFDWVERLSPEAANLQLAAGKLRFGSGSVTLSLDPSGSGAYFLKHLSYVLLFAMTLLLVSDRGRVEKLAYVLVFSGLFQALFGSLMTVSGIEYGFFRTKTTGVDNATGTYINPNHLAGYLEMCLAIGIGLLLADPGSGNTWRQSLRKKASLLFGTRYRLRLYVALMIIALVLTHSRMGNAAFVLSLLVAVTAKLALSRHATRATIALLVSLIIIDISIVGTFFGAKLVVQRIADTRYVTEERKKVNDASVRQWQDYFLTGSGAGTFHAVFPRYRQEDIGGFFDHAHNDYLEIATDTGLVGVALLGLTIALTTCAALRALYLHQDRLTQGMAFGSVMGITAILIHSLVDFNMQIPANAATFAVIMALAWISFGMGRDDTRMELP
jgi:putative inorganic carbon (hco3(-)) transporter